MKTAAMLDAAALPQEQIMGESQPPDAIEMMEHDHRTILALFRRYREAAMRGEAFDQRRSLAEEICMALTIHTRLENEMFYPVVQSGVPGGGKAAECEPDHGQIREVVARILRMEPNDATCDTQVLLLGRVVEHHMHQESEYLFPALRGSGVNLRCLADRVEERRGELNTVAEALREDALLPATA